MASKSDKSLKRLNLKWLVAYAVFLAIGGAWAFELFHLEGLDKMTATARAVIAAPVTPFLALLAIGVLSSHLKAALVFWRWRDPLPAGRLMLRMGDDPRIDEKAVRRSTGPLPRSARKRNALWYQIYKKHQDTNAVKDAHGSYLLFRDAAALTLLTLIALAAISLVVTNWNRSGPYGYGALLVFLYLCCAVAARNSGKRMVFTVLAEESANCSEK